MIVKRNKLFTSPFSDNKQQQISARDIQVEGMKTQRQILGNSQDRAKLLAQEQQSKMKNLRQTQQIAARRDEAEMREQVKTQKLNALSPEPAERNWGSIRMRSIPTPPVPMKH